MRNIDQIPLAIADLESQELPNISATARKYNFERKTLANRWNGKSLSRLDSSSTYRQYLTNSQETALIELINSLTNRGMPLTSAIVKNLAKEIRGCAVGKNWTAQFVYRHKDQLKSLYLKSIDNKRFKGEYTPVYKLFY